jgi:hypothetical protein
MNSSQQPKRIQTSQNERFGRATNTNQASDGTVQVSSLHVPIADILDMTHIVEAHTETDCELQKPTVWRLLKTQDHFVVRRLPAALHML